MELLAALRPHYAAFAAAVEPYGPRILALANPGMAPGASATAAWPMMRFADAAAVALAYLALVLFGLLFKTAPGAAQKEEKLSFLAGIQKEPIKLLAIVYNAAQVRGAGAARGRGAGAARVRHGRPCQGA